MLFESIFGLLAATAELIVVIAIGILVLASFVVYLICLALSELMRYAISSVSKFVFGYFPKVELSINKFFANLAPTKESLVQEDKHIM